MTDFNERNPIEVVADDFTQRCRRGESPSIEEYAQKHPELSQQIHQLFPSIALMERFGAREHSHRRAAQSRTTFDPDQIQQIGDYRIIQEIGRGGMGIVYEAVQESLGRRVAVKVLSRQALLDGKHVRRFRREAKTAAGLHHTNIVPVFGAGQQADYHYYVMQFIRGVGLDEVLSELRHGSPPAGPTLHGRAQQVASVVRALREGVFRRPRRLGDSTELGDWPGLLTSAEPSSGDVDPGSEATQAIAATAVHQDTDVESLNCPESARSPFQRTSDQKPVDLGTDYWHSVARIGLQVADALQYAHSQGTLHRDIKPANLLLNANGVVWVADFGLAKALEHDDVSQTGDVVGTLRYMAPEQFAGQADHRSDIYSLGLTLYEALTLKPAYDDSSRAHLLFGRGNRSEFIRPRNLNPAIPRNLETIVLKTCAHDSVERYQTAGELAADLHRFLEDQPIQARQATPLERLFRWCRRNPAVASLSSLATVLLLLVAASTSIGYVRTNAALSRESDQRARAVAERQKAEMTLGISLEALDKVYQRFAPDRLIEPALLTVEDADGEQLAVPSQPVLSQETAALLEDILAFYDRFAQQDTGNLTLRAEAAKANRRVGDIQQRLGAYESAENAYLRAIDRYLELGGESHDAETYRTELARIHNELGNVYRAWQRPLDARESYLAALNLLQSLATADDSSSELRFELARTFYLLAKRNPPPPDPRPPGGGRGPGRGPAGPPSGRGPRFPNPFMDGPPRQRPGARRGPLRGPPGPDREFRGEQHYLDQAIALLTGHDQRELNHPEHRYLLALCYRERARGTQSEDGLAAITILEELSRQYPRIADYRYELSETYARVDLRGTQYSDLSAVQERLRTALAYADALTAEHPHIPDYAHSRAQINHKLGTALRHAARQGGPLARVSLLKESELHYREAVRIQSLLIEQFPKAVSYRMWLARMQGSWADALADSNQLEEAQSILEASISNLESIVDDKPFLWFVHHALAEHNQTLAGILDHLNQQEAAHEARKRAAEHRPRGL